MQARCEVWVTIEKIIFVVQAESLKIMHLKNSQQLWYLREGISFYTCVSFACSLTLVPQTLGITSMTAQSPRHTQSGWLPAEPTYCSTFKETLTANIAARNYDGGTIYACNVAGCEIF